MFSEDKVTEIFYLAGKQRIHIHKTFVGLASRVRCSPGCFFEKKPGNMSMAGNCRYPQESSLKKYLRILCHLS